MAITDIATLRREICQVLEPAVMHRLSREEYETIVRKVIDIVNREMHLAVQTICRAEPTVLVDAVLRLQASSMTTSRLTSNNKE